MLLSEDFRAMIHLFVFFTSYCHISHFTLTVTGLMNRTQHLGDSEVQINVIHKKLYSVFYISLSHALLWHIFRRSSHFSGWEVFIASIFYSYFFKQKREKIMEVKKKERFFRRARKSHCLNILQNRKELPGKKDWRAGCYALNSQAITSAFV